MKLVWVQEEPGNMGAHFYVTPRLQRLAQDKGRKVRAVKRSASASPATGRPRRMSWNKRRFLSFGVYHPPWGTRRSSLAGERYPAFPKPARFFNSSFTQ